MKIKFNTDRHGTKRWKLDGLYHREDGPAIEWANGNEEWFINGNRHRINGPAICNSYGYKCWYLNGQLHREDGPAVIFPSGRKEWWLNNLLHRIDGPAQEYNNYKGWYLNGIECSYEEWFNELTIEQQHNYLWNLT